MDMKRTLIVVGICAGLVGSVAAFAPASPRTIKVIASCPGSERWDVKVLADPAANTVNYSHVVATNVGALRRQVR
jgi:hypothetical protein